jgi:hypothetical protein
MSDQARIRRNIPTFILVGGTFTADTGERLDSRQPWAEDARSWMARDTLVESEIWWRTVTSLVFPLLDAEGEDSFALIDGIRMVVTVKPDGSILQRRLTSVLPGGFHTATKSIGRWQYPQYPDVSSGGPSDSTAQGRPTARIIVRRTGFSYRSSYPEFEREWLQQGNVTIVVPHTHATSVYLDGYVEWVADGRPENVPGPLFSRDVYDATRLSKVVPIEGDFRVTGVLQKENWADPVPLEAARFLLQARFDLKLGIWDLITNDVLRSTLLKETSIVAPPTAPAARTAGAIERQEVLRARLGERHQSRAAYLAETAALVGSLDASGWTSSLPGVLAENPYRRTLPIAVAPECDDAEARTRHPAMRPGKTILWLQFTIRRDRLVESKVELVVPAPLSSLRLKIFDPFFEEHLPELARIAEPNVAKSRIVVHDRETISYEVMDYDYSGGIEAGKAYQAMDKKIFWAERIAAVAQRTPAWVELFAPLAEQCRDAITANPRLGRT